MENVWVNANAPARNDRNERTGLILPFGTRGIATGNQRVLKVSGKPVEFAEVQFILNAPVMVWLYAGFLEPYVEQYRQQVVKITNATPSEQDGAQYMIYKGNVQYNLCGEMCVCYCAGWNLDVDAFLGAWQLKSPSWYNRTFQDGRARVTGVAEVENMFQVFEGYHFPLQRLGDALLDPVAQQVILSPRRMGELLETQRVILSVKIDGRFGNLQSNGILHWVVLESFQPDGIDRGRVLIYNPFPNRFQEYSWQELKHSMGAPYGLVVPFDINQELAPQKVAK